MNTNKILLSFLFCIISIGINAQVVLHRSDKLRPKWIKNFSSLNSNSSYEFKLVEDAGANLTDLQNNRINNLGNYLQHTNKINGVINRDVEVHNSGDEYNSKVSHKFSFKTETSVKEFECVMIDNYWEEVQISNNQTHYNLYTLYAVSNEQYPYFDSFLKTTNYGAHGLWRSAIVPGWGQLYKGSKVKGGCIMGGCAALIAGIIVTENQRSVYSSKITKTHSAELKRSYANKADNMAIGRNIFIGATAALYIYNLVDAIVAPGARRVVVKKRDGTNRVYSFSPVVTPMGDAGLSASVEF